MRRGDAYDRVKRRTIGCASDNGVWRKKGELRRDIYRGRDRLGRGRQDVSFIYLLAGVLICGERLDDDIKK